MSLTSMTQRLLKSYQRPHTHISVSQRRQHMGKDQKVLSSWGERNKAPPSPISAIMHGITLWRKGHQLSPPNTLTTPVANAFKKQTNIGWLQSLMGLISHDWEEIQSAYLRSLAADISRVIWISSIIRKLWNNNWDIWNFRNHNLHATDVPRKI